MVDVTIYTRMMSGYCAAAKSLLDRKGVSYTEHDASFSPELRQEMLARANGRYTFPQIFVGDVHVDLDAPELPKAITEKAFSSGGFPYDKKLKGSAYDEQIRPLQIELLKLQTWAQASGARISPSLQRAAESRRNAETRYRSSARRAASAGCGTVSRMNASTSRSYSEPMVGASPCSRWARRPIPSCPGSSPVITSIPVGAASVSHQRRSGRCSRRNATMRQTSPVQAPA